MNRLRAWIVRGPSAFLIGVLAAAAIGMTFPRLRAQAQNVVTMYGCITVTNGNCTTLQPVAVNSSGAISASVSGGNPSFTSVTLGQGLVSSPTLRMGADTNTGWWQSHSNTWDFASNGTGRLTIVGNSHLWRWEPAMVVGWSSSDPQSNNLDTAFSRLAGNSVALGNGSPGDFTGNLKLLGLTTGGGFVMTTTAALANGAGASTGTLTNAPAATNPTKWIPINDNGTTRFIPAW